LAAALTIAYSVSEKNLSLDQTQGWVNRALFAFDKQSFSADR